MESRQALKAKILEHFPTLCSFGFSIGWVPQKVHRMVNESFVPKVTEARKICKELQITMDQLVDYFDEPD